MKRALLFFSFLFLIIAFLCGPAELIASNKPETLLKHQNSKTGFTENKGQIIDQNNKSNPAVLYLMNTPGMNVQLRSSGWSYDVYKIESSVTLPFAFRHSPFASEKMSNNTNSEQRKANSYHFHRIDIDLLNANPYPTIETSSPSSNYLNYYTTGTPVEGVTNVRSFATVTYKNIYPRIDLQFVADNDNSFEYNFILQPGADINAIKLKVYGPEKIKTFREGLRCETSLGDIDETIPVCYYTMNDIRVPVKGRFKKITEHLYGFTVDQPIPAGAFLLIDPIPTRRWGTYYGGDAATSVFEEACAIDGQGNCIVAGTTSSTNNIASSGAYQVTMQGVNNAFLVKFSPDGQRQWGTYYGGSGGDAALCCTIDRNNNIIFAGAASSPNNIASPGAYQTVLHGENDGMLVKFTPGGQRIWGTYYGGNESSSWGDEEIDACAVDTSGNIYFSGETSSPDYIASPGAHQVNIGGMSDVFLVKFTTDGQRVWGTYYGGSNLDQNGNCAVVKNGSVYLSGNTNSPNNIATPGSFLSTYNGNPKSFLVYFNADGQRQWGTYYAGEFIDVNYGCTADTGNNVYIFGATGSNTNIGTPGAFQETSFGGANAYLAKFNPIGQRIWGTYYGADGADIRGGVVDDSGYVFITGLSHSQNSIFAPPGSFQTIYRGGNDAFLAKFNSSGTNRIWGTYYGGTGQDVGLACAVDTNDNIYMCGNTWSVNHSDGNASLCKRSLSYNYIATPGSFQTEKNGTPCAYLVKFADCNSPDTALQINGPVTLCQNTNGYVFSIDPIPTATDYTWCVTGSLTITAGQHTTSITVSTGSKTGLDTISVYGINSCDAGFPKLLVVNVIPRPVPVITGNPNPLLGSSETYSTETGKTNYQWTFSSGGTLVSGGGVNDPTITIQWNAIGAQWIRVNYTDANGCITLTPTQMDIMVTTTLTVDFTSPDTVCVGAPVNITNLTQGGTSFYWNFCSGNVNNDPAGLNIGNPGGLLSVPTYLTLVKQNDSCFSFISCQGVGVIRYYHGTSFANNPVSWTNLGTFGLIGPNEEGIQVKSENGSWYGFVNNNTTIIRLNFGTSLMNTPTATNIGPFPSFNMAHGLVITQEGTTWVGFVTCSLGQKLVQLNFGNSLANIPVATDFGSIGGALTGPSAICLVKENFIWYAIVMSGDNNLARLTFGASLLNAPTGVNLGNPGGFNAAGGLTLLRECSSTTGYWTNYLVNGQLGKLTFPNGITGSVTGTILGNIGGLAQPHSFSEIFRQNDTLFAYITNRFNGTLTRLTFPPCTNSSVGSSNLFNPPSFSYNQPGTYNLNLIVNEGMPDETTLCKQVVVKPLPVVNLGLDPFLCPGNTTTLDAGPGNSSYLWSNGATTQTLVVNTAGTYWAEVTKNGCTARDTVIVSYYTVNPVNLGADTTICQGLTRTFDAGPCPGCAYQWGNITTGQPNIGSGQTYTTGQAGKYMATTTDTHGCQNRDTVQLFVTPVDTVGVSVSTSANPICAGTSVTFTAIPTHGGASPQYQWKVNGIVVGTNLPTFSYIPLNGDLVSCILTSSEICTSSNPAYSISITMVVNNNLPAVVSISTSANPFCPGSSITFTAAPTNGGAGPAYQWKINGINAGTNSSTYTYNPVNNDSVRCVMTSNLSCVIDNPVSSNKIIMSGTLAPSVSFTSCFDTITMINAKPIRLKGGVPLGGTYSGPGVNSNTSVFTPSVAGTGIKTISYSYTNAALCSASKSRTIIVQPAPVFACGNNLTDIRDNKVYSTVLIGSQCWLASNLNFGAILASSQDQRDNCQAEKYCYNDNPTNCTNFGGLYQWDELMLFDETPANQGFCPPGWHIPTENEWNTLFANYINNAFAASPLKYSGYSGFNALLSGARHINKGWSFQGFATFFWSSTNWGSTKAWAHGMNEDDSSVSIYLSSRVNAFSVRCLKD